MVAFFFFPNLNGPSPFSTFLVLREGPWISLSSPLLCCWCSSFSQKTLRSGVFFFQPSKRRNLVRIVYFYNSCMAGLVLGIIKLSLPFTRPFSNSPVTRPVLIDPPPPLPLSLDTPLLPLLFSPSTPALALGEARKCFLLLSPALAGGGVKTGHGRFFPKTRPPLKDR